MRTDETTWLNRKTWRRLVELHATGRITRAELQRLKDRLARPRPAPRLDATLAAVAAPAAPPARLAPRLTLLRGGGGDRPPGPATPSPRSPSPREVA